MRGFLDARLACSALTSDGGDGRARVPRHGAAAAAGSRVERAGGECAGDGFRPCPAAAGAVRVSHVAGKDLHCDYSNRIRPCPAAAAAAGAAGAGGRRAGAGGGAQGRPAGASSPSRHPYLRSFSSSENGLLALVDLCQRCHTRSTALKAALRVPHPLALMIRTEYCRRQHRVFSSSASSILIIRIEYSHHQHRVLSSSASSTAVVNIDRLHTAGQAPPQRCAWTGADSGVAPRRWSSPPAPLWLGLRRRCLLQAC